MPKPNKSAPVQRPQVLNVTTEDAARARAADPDFDKKNRILCEPQPGMQDMVMRRTEFEIFAGGEKAGGKSYIAIAWLIKGNYVALTDKSTAIDVAYINCPDYRALGLRKNRIDLDSWCDEAWPIYRELGATFTRNPDEFVFHSGAKITLGHLADEHAVTKYFGNRVHRVFLDEATFVPSKVNYLKLLSCLRSSIPGILPQIYLTANPEGPGVPWVVERFIEAKDENGNIIPPMTTIRERSWNPFLKDYQDTTRIFIPSKLGENKKLLDSDPTYHSRLSLLDEPERKAYLEGDWYAKTGTVFKSYRDRRRPGEPPEALHVIPDNSMRFEPWYPRFGGCDWGYRHHSVVFGAVQMPNGQQIVHRELAVKEMGSLELGEAIGRMFLPDLEALYVSGELPTITIWLSPDAFNKRDEDRSTAELIQAGCARVVGPTAAHLGDIFKADPVYGVLKGSWDSLELRERSGLIFRRAKNQRIAAVQHVRELLRWQRFNAANIPFDPDIYSKLLHENVQRAEAYRATTQRTEPEVLPKLLIEEHCINLRSALPALVYDEGLEDVLKLETLADDCWDALYYMVYSQHVVETRIPKTAFVLKRIAEMKKYEPGMDFNGMVWVAQQAEASYEAERSALAPFSMPNASSRRFKEHVQ